MYNVAGPAGPAKFEAGVAGYEARAFRGCGVVTSTPFEISDDADSLQMLQRNTQVGEFYRMRAPSIDWTPADKDKAKVDAENAKHKNYMVRARPQAASSLPAARAASHLWPAPHPQPQDIVIYNEESDMHVHIAFKDAIEAACVDDTTLQKMFGKNKAGLIKANEEGEYVKMSFVIARPFIEHRMMSAVLAVAGTDTGATLFGPAGARRRLSGPCTHFPSPQRSHPSSRLRSQTCRSRRTRRSRRSRAT